MGKSLDLTEERFQELAAKVDLIMQQQTQTVKEIVTVTVVPAAPSGLFEKFAKLLERLEAPPPEKVEAPPPEVTTVELKGHNGNLPDVGGRPVTSANGGKPQPMVAPERANDPQPAPPVEPVHHFAEPVNPILTPPPPVAAPPPVTSAPPINNMPVLPANPAEPVEITPNSVQAVSNPMVTIPVIQPNVEHPVNAPLPPPHYPAQHPTAPPLDPALGARPAPPAPLAPHDAPHAPPPPVEPPKVPAENPGGRRGPDIRKQKPPSNKIAVGPQFRFHNQFPTSFLPMTYAKPKIPWFAVAVPPEPPERLEPREPLEFATAIPSTNPALPLVTTKSVLPLVTTTKPVVNKTKTKVAYHGPAVATTLLRRRKRNTTRQIVVASLGNDMATSWLLLLMAFIILL